MCKVFFGAIKAAVQPNDLLRVKDYILILWKLIWIHAPNLDPLHSGDPWQSP